MVNKSNSIPHDNIVKLHYINRYDVWVAYDFRWIASPCTTCFRHDPTLQEISNAGWKVFKTVHSKRAWRECDQPPLSIPKGDIHPKKVVSGSIEKECSIMTFY